MSRADLSEMTCSVARTVEIIGDSWTLMILRELFLGSRRFDALQKQTGGSPHLISQRLKRLVGEGILDRRAYQQRPARYEYFLTDKGLDLWPVIIALKGWGDRWTGWTDDLPVTLVHRACGHDTDPELSCSHCREPIGPRDVKARMSDAMQAERRDRTG